LEQSRIFTAAENLRGIMLMVAARILFSVNDAFSKLAGETMPATQVMAFRGLVGVLVLVVMAWQSGALQHLAHMGDKRVMRRAWLEAVGVFFFLTALPLVHLGQATVILQMVPLLLVPLSAILLKEQVGWRRWAAIVVGFVGVVFVAGPMGGDFNPYLLLVFITAIGWAFRDLMTQSIMGKIPTVIVTLATTGLVSVLGFAGAAVQTWTMPSPEACLYLAGAGFFIAFSNHLMIVSLRAAALAVVAPFRYTAVLWAIIWGFLIWSEVPDAWAIIGTILIVGSGIYIFYREMTLARQARKAAA